MNLLTVLAAPPVGVGAFAGAAPPEGDFAAVDELIESWTKTLTKDDVAQRMLAAAVPCAPVRDLAEVMNDENMHARGSLQWIDHPELGRVALPHSPLVFEGTQRRPLEPSLPLGASNDAVFGAWLGHSEQELAGYKAEGVIGNSDEKAGTNPLDL